MTTWTHMAALVAEIPVLPDAACKGRAADLFDLTIGVPVDGRPTRQELEAARTSALAVCAACPALNPCRAWFDGLRPSQQPRGVVAGLIVKADGRKLGQGVTT